MIISTHQTKVAAVVCFATFVLTISPLLQAEERVQIAVFKGEGVGQSVNDLLRAIDGDKSKEFAVRRITADEIRAGQLGNVDILIHPGGSGSRQGKDLGKTGQKAVQDFVNNGGGFLGICAGAYLATNDYSWSLNLIDAKVTDRKHWARGTGLVEVLLSPTGKLLFDAGDDLKLYYGQGPLLSRREWDDKDIPDYQSLGIYKTGIAEKGAPAGVMPGTSAIVRARYGKGRVFCFSCHPEMTKGRGPMITVALRWLYGKADQNAVEVEGISSIVRRHIPDDSPGGIGVLVTTGGGDILHRRGYGLKSGRRLTTKTRLSLASITKQFAAMCAAMLIEEGRLDPRQKVSHYLPGLKLPVKGRELIVQDLLWHTSGLADFITSTSKIEIAKFKEERGLGKYLTNETHAKWLETMELKNAPGQLYSYTSSGYVLLARIIEVIAGEPFHVFQKRRIFDVLEMSSTTDSTGFNGSGSMGTTLIDYAKWDKALWRQDPRLLKPQSYKMLFAKGVFDNGKPTDYGFGWHVNYRNGELLTAEHSGHGSGTTAARNFVRRHYKDDTTVAIFAQENPGISRDRRKALVSEIYEYLLKTRPAK